jgi:hypothetical protein
MAGHICGMAENLHRSTGHKHRYTRFSGKQRIVNLRLMFAMSSPNMDRMISDYQSLGEYLCGIGLRAELSIRNLKFATAHGFLYERTDGKVPSIIFGHGEDGRHGNFHPASYDTICSNQAWNRRLNKVHTVFKRSRVRANWQWRELDCATSSDALLMNIFCHPEVMSSGQVPAILGVEACSVPQFGFKPRTPLTQGKYDSTEIDMKIGNLLVEAKLTESDFQSSRVELIRRYRDLETVFDLSMLPMRKDKNSSYQLIRSTLAAHATGCSFCVMSDSRRPDLIEDWYRILRAVHIADLRCRLKLLTWQELAEALPPGLQRFLAAKYGISPPQKHCKVDSSINI